MRPSFTILVVFAFVLLSGFQFVKTVLSVTVRDEVGNTVAGATVQLFANEEDYKSEKNVVMEGVTDSKGALKLKDLKPISYFVIVTKGDLDNSGGGERTGKLDENRTNKVTIIIQ
ncbi:MAG TPA: carboxypeptidase-like regulatory domain-containing protein [Chryseolinea sp.]|nr:carboxypeptidase-like regulatory domain-containing protein [Chryseolinea sp.]